jgi:hypothetical protein
LGMRRDDGWIFPRLDPHFARLIEPLKLFF